MAADRNTVFISYPSEDGIIAERVSKAIKAKNEGFSLQCGPRPEQPGYSAPDEPEKFAHWADDQQIHGRASAVEFAVGTGVPMPCCIKTRADRSTMPRVEQIRLSRHFSSHAFPPAELRRPDSVDKFAEFDKTTHRQPRIGYDLRRARIGRDPGGENECRSVFPPHEDMFDAAMLVPAAENKCLPDQ
jgi:hypothetical protein